MLSRTAATSCRVLRCTYHFTSDCIVERDPGLPQLRSKFGAKLLLEAPDQRVAKCDEVRRVNAETRVLAPAMTNDRLKQFALVQSAHDCRDHVHELKVLSFHIAGEQALGVGSEFKKVAVKS